MEAPTTTVVGQLCRGDEFADSKARERYEIGTPWTCPYRAVVEVADGEIEYRCRQELTRTGANTVVVTAGRACLRDVMREHPADWENQLSLRP